MSNSDATKPTPRTDVHTFDFDRQLERELTEAQAAIADLNQRLNDQLNEQTHLLRKFLKP